MNKDQPMTTTMTTPLCLSCNNEENNRILFQSLSSLLLTKTKKKKSYNLKKTKTATETEILSDLVTIPKKKRNWIGRVRNKCSTHTSVWLSRNFGRAYVLVL